MSPTPPVAELASVFGRAPLLPAEREYGMLSAHGTCFAYGIATWCFLLGGFAADLLGAVQGTVCLVAGNLIGVFLATMPLSLACQRFGLEQMDFCKTAFGQHGSHVILVFYLVNMLGWSGLLLVMFGKGLSNIADAFALQPGGWVVGAGVALGLCLSYLIASRGVHRMGFVNNLVTPALAAVVLYMLYMLFTAYGWEAIANARPLDPGPDPLLNYATVLELGIANGFAWWGGIGFIARNTDTRRNATYPQILQLGLSSGVVSSVALFASLAVGSDDPTEWMVPLGGLVMGVLALGFVALANITSTAVSLFASGLALRHVPGLRRRPWRQLLLLTCVPCMAYVFWAEQLYDGGDAFLAYNGTMYAPISGVLFVDFFLLQRQRIDLRAIFDNAAQRSYHYWNGFNPLALGCVLLGQIVYLSIYNPVSGESHALFRYVPASLAAFAVPALVYWVGMQLRRRVARAVPLAASTDSRRLAQPNI